MHEDVGAAGHEAYHKLELIQPVAPVAENDVALAEVGQTERADELRVELPHRLPPINDVMDSINRCDRQSSAREPRHRPG